MGKPKSDGVTSYTRATVELFFPDGYVCCAHCPLLETYARNQCRRTGEYLVDTRYRGLWCPLKIEENTEE
jgi:hypothetical protein